MRAVIYARYSTEMQRDGNSIAGQFLACREYAKKNNFTVVGEYADEAVSGQKQNRVAFNQILSDAKKGMFDAVIVHALTRATRFQDLFDYYNFKHSLLECNIKLYSATEDINNSDIGDIIEFMSIWQSKREIINIRKNVERGLKVNAIAGKFNGGTPPLGYDIGKNKDYIINEKESEIVKKIFELFNNGLGYYNIASYLNALGHKTRFQKQFGSNSIREILKNKKYIGIYEYNRTPARDRYGKRNSHAKKNAEDIITLENVIPQIIDKEVFNMTQERLTKRTNIKQTAIEPYLLSGILVCENCGNSYSGRYFKERHKHYYECSGKKRNATTCPSNLINRDEIEKSIIDYLSRLISNTTAETIDTYYNTRYKELKQKAKAESDEIGIRLKQLKEEASLLVDKLLELDTPALREKIKEKDAQIAIIEKAFADAKSSEKALKEITYENLCEALTLPKPLTEMSRDELKQTIYQFIKKITVLVTVNANNEKTRDITIYTRLPQMIFGEKFCITNFGVDYDTTNPTNKNTENEQKTTVKNNIPQLFSDDNCIINIGAEDRT